MIKRFHLGDVISITHDRLVSPSHIDGIYAILNFLTGENLFTHQLPRASESCKSHLLKLIPALKELTIADGEITKENHKEWLNSKVEIYGEWHDLIPLNAGVYEARDPILEAWEMKGADKVIPINLIEK